MYSIDVSKPTLNQIQI